MLIILDRDGVINQYDGGYICSAEQWHPLPGSIAAIARLNQAGYRVAIATNQSGIGRGYYTETTLASMHNKLKDLLHPMGGQVDFIAYCPHRPDEHCHCRKPKTGLLEQISQHFDLPSLAGCTMVGDSRQDLEAGIAANCAPVLVRTGNGHDTEQHLAQRPLPGVRIFDDLAAFTLDLLTSSELPSCSVVTRSGK